MRRRLGGAAAFLASGVTAGLVLGGCADDGPARAGDDGLAGATYVALGDSYTAAPTVGATSFADGCFRASENYPALLAERLSMELTDVSCGGATTGHLARPQLTPTGDEVAPQLDAVSATTDVVTISLGGNDFGLFATLVQDCRDLGRRDPTGSPCADAGTALGAGGVRDTTARIGRRLLDGIAAVRDRAPRARIVVVGYPQIVPPRGSCRALPVARGDAAFARRVNELLVEQMSAAAAAADAEYVDVFAATEGHDLCSDDPWIAGRSPGPPESAPYHPLAAEQRLVADLLAELLAG